MYVRIGTIPYLTNKEEKLNTKMRRDKTYQMLRGKHETPVEKRLT